MRGFYDQEERDRVNWERAHRRERDNDREPRAAFPIAPPRRRQFRYWAGAMFRPSRARAARPRAGASR